MNVANWLENHMLPCFYKQFFGLECPGCGMQRSFIEMLKGNVWISLKLYPALPFVLITLSLLLLHLVLKLKRGALVIKYSFIVTVSIITVSYFIKLFS